MSETGQVVFRFADEIFSLGRELQDTLKDRPVGKPIRVKVGIADVVPKLIARRFLEPVLEMQELVQLICIEGKPDQLLEKLAFHELDVILTDGPSNPQVKVKAFNHSLGQCPITFLGTKELASKYRKGFPSSLDGAPVLLPTENTRLRQSLEHWFENMGIRPRIVGEFEDGALLKAFGQIGTGIFPIPTVIANEIKRQSQVLLVGKVPDVFEQYFAITVSRKIRHPAVEAVYKSARKLLANDAKPGP